MKKVCTIGYFLIMALLILTMSGCGGSSSGGGSTATQSAQSRRMVFTSSALKRDGSYNLYRGDQVSTIEGITSKYYLAPVTRGTEEITMNLEFDSAVSQDLPFMITDSDGSTVLFYYNPQRHRHRHSDSKRYTLRRFPAEALVLELDAHGLIG